MKMNVYSLSSLLASVFCLILGFFIFIKRQEDKRRKFFGIASMLTALWTSFPFFMSKISDPSSALFFARLIYVPAAFVAPAWLHFTFSIMREKLAKEKRKILTLTYGSAIILLPFWFTPFFIKGINRFAPHFSVVPGPFYLVFISIFGIIFTNIIKTIFEDFKVATGYQKNQLKYILLSFVFGFFSGILHFGAAYFNKEPFPHDFLLLGYTGLMAYAIVRYRTLDIKVAVTRAGIFIVVYTLILGLPFAITVWAKGWLIDKFGPGWWVVPLGLMGALATVGPFIYIYLQRKAEDRLLREQRQYQLTLKEASVGMTRIRSLRKLLDLITHIVTKTVKISYAAIYLYNQETDEYVLQVSRDKDRIPIQKLSSDNPLIAWIVVKREPLIYEEVKRQMEDSNNVTYKLLEENMRLLHASVVIPSFLEDRFLGFFILGDKISREIYTYEDLNVFQILASQAALAIENAQFYEETKEMQDQIAQAEKMATIGTMADGLSHQINNRFYALSLIAGDTIDTIKMTDTSKCTPEVKEMISQINHALERIQSNVVQGGQVLQGLMKYSRKGDSGFEALDLNTVIDNTLEMVQYKVKLSDIDIIRDFPKDTPKIKGNMAQLQEVFFNFIDNAYDATVERSNFLKEQGYRGEITITAQPKDNNLEIIVQDNGIGVKDTNKERIFTPFFTSKATSRKGTGLGLYVIRRIISEIHKGKISFESEYKVGTKFILELPIAK